MKKFNRVIKVEVSIDTIASSILSKMNNNFPHAELLVENIVGSANEHQLSLMYNALNGYLPEIDFKVGDMIIPNELKEYAYWKASDTEQSYGLINKAKIVAIDLYAKEKLQIEYTVPRRNKASETLKKWISHIGCLVSND